MQFSMPMFRPFVPEVVRPWIYVVIAFCIQLSGGLYLGALHEIVSSRQMLLEDVLMCLYCNLGGMSVYFPLLFRMKFRFTNKLLLTGSALTLAAMTICAAYAPNLPTLWACCTIAGFCKIQGTFECMSNIQLWITPKRDFRVFFPVLHIFILGAMQVSDYVAAHVAYTWGWEEMHWIMTGIFMSIGLVLMLLTRRVHIMPPMKLLGVDWIGGLLWLAWLLQLAFVFCYGETYDWFHSPIIRNVTIGCGLTFVITILRSYLVRHPFISPEIWKTKRLMPTIVIVALAECCLATEHVLEEVFYEEGMQYSNLVTAELDIWAFIGVITGCLFALLWLKVLQLNTLRLVTVGFFLLAAYLIMFYTTLQTELNIEMLRLPIMARSIAYAVISAALMVLLEDIMTFQTFFMALSVFNMAHMIIGGVIGAALYSRGLDHFMADNMVRYAQYFDHISMSQNHMSMGEMTEMFSKSMMVVSIKQLYGIVAYACIGIGLLLLLVKVPLIKRGYKRMQYWRDVGKRLANTLL